MRLLATILKNNRHNKYYFMTKAVKVIEEGILKTQISCSGCCHLVIAFYDIQKSVEKDDHVL